MRGRLRTYKQGEKHLLDHFIPHCFSRYEALPRNAVREEHLKNCFTEYARQSHAVFIPRQSHGMSLSTSLLDFTDRLTVHKIKVCAVGGDAIEV